MGKSIGYSLIDIGVGGKAPHPIRISSNGNLVVSTRGPWPDGSLCIGCKGDEPKWPIIYTTEKEAWAAQEAIEKSCEHQWQTISHEERYCSKCGALEFVMDA